MWSISCSKINQKVGGYRYVPFWCLFQKALPVLRGNRIVTTPLARHIFVGQIEVGSHFLAAPCFHDFGKTLHDFYCGAKPHDCQVAKPQCYISLNRGKYPL